MFVVDPGNMHRMGVVPFKYSHANIRIIPWMEV
jgi:hypothetical protein